MTDQQKQHLTQLIKTSAILNAQEREEWLMLLDLMNDKQVGELERILTPATPFANGAASPGAKPAPANLPMTHIVNLPKPPQPKPAQDKTLSKFAEHLNQILAEKDLPPSEQKSPLDLPKGETKPPAAPKPKPQPPAVAPAPPAPTEVREAQPKSSIYDIMPVVVEQPIYLKKSLPPKVAPAPPEDLDGYGRYDKSTEERVQSPAVSGKIINNIFDC
jgi:hypothetical protein